MEVAEMKMQEFEEMSDLKFAATILQERLDKLSNPFTPFSAKLESAIRTIRDLDGRGKE